MTGQADASAAVPVYRVVIADDDAHVRRTLANHLASAADLVVVGLAASGPQAVKLALERAADVVLMDLRMPGGDGYAATRALHRVRPAIVVVAITALASHDAARAAVRSGARGFVRKTAGRAAVVNTVRLAASGQTVLPHEDFTRLAGPATVRAAPDALPELTPRERDVLRGVAAGKTNRQIGEALTLAEGTVKMHLTTAMKKLGVTSRTQALRAAYELGLGPDA